MITDPRDIPGLLLWLSADEIEGVADGAALTSWSDVSGADNHTVAVAGTPTYRATLGPDGGPCVEFDAGDTFTLPNIFSGKASGFIIAGMWSTAGGLDCGGWDFGTHTSGSHFPYSNGQMYDDFGSSTRHDNIVPVVPMNSWHRLSIWSAASDWTMRQNEQVARAASSPVAWHASPRIGTTTGSGGAQIRLSFVALVDHKPTAQELADLDAYFTANMNGGLAPDRPVEASPAVSTLGLHEAAQLRWAHAPLSDTHEYRIDGGTPVDVGAATRTLVTGLTNGTQYSVEMRGVNVLGPGPWSAPVTVTPQVTVLYDDYDRPNSTTTPGAPIQGGPYTPRTATWGINSEALYAASSTSEGHMTFPGAVDFDVTMRVKTPGGNAGLLFRWIDASNTWLFQFHTSGITFHRRTGGTWQQRGPSHPPVQAGDVLRLIAKGSAILAYRNGRLILTNEDLYLVQATATMGFRFSQDTVTRLDEIHIVPAGQLPTGPADLHADEPLLADSTHDQGFIYKGRDTKLADEGAVA